MTDVYVLIENDVEEPENCGVFSSLDRAKGARTVEWSDTPPNHYDPRVIAVGKVPNSRYRADYKIERHTVDADV